MLTLNNCDMPQVTSTCLAHVGSCWLWVVLLMTLWCFGSSLFAFSWIDAAIHWKLEVNSSELFFLTYNLNASQCICSGKHGRLQQTDVWRVMYMQSFIPTQHYSRWFNRKSRFTTQTLRKVKLDEKVILLIAHCVQRHIAATPGVYLSANLDWTDHGQVFDLKFQPEWPLRFFHGRNRFFPSSKYNRLQHYSLLCDKNVVIKWQKTV